MNLTLGQGAELLAHQIP